MLETLLKLFAVFFNKKPVIKGEEQGPPLPPKPVDLVTLEGYIGNKFPKYEDEWTGSHERSAWALLQRTNKLLRYCGMKAAVINSGWRPERYNKKIGGAKRSLHIKAQAIDIGDPKGVLGDKLLKAIDLLEMCNLWMEDPRHTKTWVHLQTRPPQSGRRVFKP